MSGLDDEKIDSEAFENEATKMTCDVLCSLGGSATASEFLPPDDGLIASDSESATKRKQQKHGAKSCPKQLQLPLFLSKTYHMIDRCDSEIASWSESGENFVVKNVDKFSSHVLPLYFKHSNFSSFARQLNFYGFRKLRSEAILTSDLDPRTVDYVRFYHENFQRGKPDLLHQIKRATKSDQHSKDDMDSVKQEVASLRDELAGVKSEYNRKIAELSYECNRRITSMNAEYDKLAMFVQQSLGAAAAAAAAASSSSPGRGGSASHAAPNSGGMHVPDLLQSLSQAAAMTLQSQLRQPAAAQPAPAPANSGQKRPASTQYHNQTNYNNGNKKFHKSESGDL